MLDLVRKSLSGKILAALSASVAMVMAVVIYFSHTHQTKEMLNALKNNNEELASAIYAGIKHPMSIGDSGAVEKALLDMRELMPDVEIFICAPGRTITFSSHEDRITSKMDEYLQSADARLALTRALETGTQPTDMLEETVSNRRYFVHIHSIANQKECVRCHGSEKQVLGAIVLKKAIDRNYAAIGAIRDNNIIISALGIIAIIILSYALMRVLISNPVKELAETIKRLPEEISHTIPFPRHYGKRLDEIGYLQDSYARMALELNEKTHAIEMTNEELAKAYKELEAFAYSVSHDLRAPLRNIDGFSKILLEDYSEQLNEKAKHYLARVRNGSMRMSVLIDDMLTFSRIGRAELQLRRSNCGAIIAGILENFSAEIASRNVSIKLGKLPDLLCDPRLMQSLFSNLIANALKYTRDTKHPEIEIGFNPGNDVLFVRDNGIGFDMRYHDKIFQVFQRLHLPEEYEGTGIGLAIVRRIAERHKGAVWAESKTGEGAAFFIQLPFAREENDDGSIHTNTAG